MCLFLVATANPPSMGAAGDGGRSRREAEAKTSGATGAAQHYFFALGCGLFIDASKAGNPTRYINHAYPDAAANNVDARIVSIFGPLQCLRR